MRRGLAMSVALHVVVIALSFWGLPELRRDLPLVEQPIMVEIVTVAERTNIPAPPPPAAKAEPPKPPPEIKAAPPPPPPPPPAAKVEPPPPEPAPREPEPEPEPKVVMAPTPPEPKPQPKPKPEPEAKPEPPVPPALAKAKPRRKPKPPDAFASVLRTVEELKSQPPKREDKTESKSAPKKEESFEQQIARALAAPAPRGDATQPLTISEIDAVRQQIARCWNLPAGAKDAANLVIEISVVMNPDATVREARIQNQARMSDPFYRAAAESALRAVLNPRCNPFKLPREKFEHWKTMTLTFNPREMFGRS